MGNREERCDFYLIIVYRRNRPKSSILDKFCILYSFTAGSRRKPPSSSQGMGGGKRKGGGFNSLKYIILGKYTKRNHFRVLW